ncbi:MAG: Ppx/GppA family phosphatase, partial [Myxococcales bacterium]|nr:Ppx/GppA family phosphatase [Myxococcales bacterium]
RPFLARASAALGHPIEVIAGEEEARLIYRGVVHDLPHADGQRQIVIDIGGGSTEVILGAGLVPEHATSLHIGCIGQTKQFFADGKLTKDRFRQATIAAQLQFERLRGPYFRGNWARAVGSSGTVNALHAILREGGFGDPGLGVTRAGLKRLRNAMIKVGHADKLDFPGLKSTRAPVLAGGLSVLYAAFKTLPLTEVNAASGALREGVMYDLLGRYGLEDVREGTIRALLERFRVDLDQAARVERTALACLDAAVDWFTDEQRELAAQYLSWAAQLHEIGLAVGFHGYHKHGDYVVRNSTMPGFSNDEQAVLAALVLVHRRKLARPEVEQVPGMNLDFFRRMAVLLRLAVHMNRNRSWRPPPDITLVARGPSIDLRFPEGYLEQNPLTLADFQDEAQRLGPAGLELTVG